MKNDHDMVIIGAGPAGMTAAIYACRAGRRVLLLAGEGAGGQMITTPTVENYPALPDTPGWELAERMSKQVQALGARMVYKRATGIERRDEGGYRVCTGGDCYDTACVIIANGVERRRLDIPGEKELSGRGVSWCATCDGALFRGKEVAVVGGGNTALEDALYLSSICPRVHLIHRRDTFRAQKALVDRLDAHPNIVRHMNTVPVEILGKDRVSGLVLHELVGGSQTTQEVAAVFVAVGSIPDNAMFTGLLTLDPAGYIQADEHCVTSADGIFAAGDTRTKELRQIVTATADGAIAATAACHYLEQTNGSPI